MCRLVHAYNSKYLQSPISTPVLRDSPWNFVHVYFAPAEQVTNALFCYISPDIRGVLYCWGYLGLEGSHISGEKNEKQSICQRLDRGTSNKCAQFQGLSLKNGVDIWTLVQLSAKIAPSLRNYLYLVYIRCWAIHMISYWPHTVSSWNICSRLWAIHALENLEAAGPEETVVICSFLYTSTTWLSLTSLKSWLVGTFSQR